MDTLAKDSRESDLPMYFGGGLSAENVGQAVRIVHPYAIDIESGASDSSEIGNNVLKPKSVLKVQEIQQALSTAK
jgi:phosphoribosylanthranilate isomerase